MSKQFTLESISNRPDASYFSPEILATLKRIFAFICEDAAIPTNAKDEREALATKLLIASKLNHNEASLVAAGRKAIANYRK